MIALGRSLGGELFAIYYKNQRTHMKKSLVILSIAALSFLPLHAFAYTNACTYNMSAFCYAEVIYKSDTCSYYVAEDSMGNYFIFDWFGGSFPQVGNIIYGQWYTYITRTMYNASMYGYPKMQIYVVSPMVSRSNLIQQYATYCPSF
jgi:hypothetical protein